MTFCVKDPEAIEAHLKKSPYLFGKRAGAQDATVLGELAGTPPDQTKYPLFYNWFTIVCIFHPTVVASWSKCAPKGGKGGKGDKKKGSKKEEKKDDDFDPFGDSDSGEEAEAKELAAKKKAEM